MKTKKLMSLIILTVSISFGCAHYHEVEGEEKKSEIPEGVRVNIGSTEVKEGDTVDIFKKKCPKVKQSSKFNPHDHPCNSQKVGSSTVIKVLTKDTAIIKVPAEFKVESDMTVEKTETN